MSGKKLVLYQFPPAFGLPNLSPFCMKVETYLRMIEAPFKTKSVMDPRTAPKGKLPYIDDDGTVLCDSQQIVMHLQQKRGDPLGDAERSSDDRARAHTVRRLCEEALYFPMLYSRWVDPAGWTALRREVFSKLPFILRSVIPPLARKGVIRQLHEQGTGRHAAGDLYAMGAADIEALSVLLGDRAYFLGERPSAVDATTYAFLATMIRAPGESPLQKKARSFDNLTSYCERMGQAYYAAA